MPEAPRPASPPRSSDAPDWWLASVREAEREIVGGMRVAALAILISLAGFLTGLGFFIAWLAGR